MGYAAHKLVTAWDRSPYLAERRDARSALILYGVQFALNLVWTPLFFGANKPVPALVDVVALTLTNYRITVSLTPTASLVLPPPAARQLC